MNTLPPGTSTEVPEQNQLRADCSRCFALCCTAFGFTRSADFAIDKPPASPCPNLGADFSCTIHDRLRPRGFPGCTVFDCFGAGQAVSQGLFQGVSWRATPQSGPAMFAVFKIMKQLYEMLWHLAGAEARVFSPDTAAEVRELREELASAADGTLQDLLDLDLDVLHGRARDVLGEVSAEIRAGYFAADGDPGAGRLHADADLAGARLRGGRLCGADLRGACLIGADLRDTDLAGVDLLGADLRDARLDGANLTGALFLTQAQVSAARGTLATLLPPVLAHPDHWKGS